MSQIWPDEFCLFGLDDLRLFPNAYNLKWTHQCSEEWKTSVPAGMYRCGTLQSLKQAGFRIQAQSTARKPD